MIQDVINMYAQAEELIDRSSTCLLSDDDGCRVAGISIQPVNELRYAGQHICRALQSIKDGGEPDPIELAAAMSHCKRSCYDSADALLKYTLLNCRAFLEDYRLVPTVDKIACIPSLTNDLHRLDELKNIQMTREDDGRENMWEAQMEYGEEAAQILHRFERGRELLNARLEEEQKAIKDKEDSRKDRKIQTGIAIAGFIITVVSSIIIIIKTILHIAI